MGKPGIPEYGDNFALETNLPYSRFFDPRLYRFKADYRWFLRSGKGSKSWQVFFAGNPVSNPFPTMREAMDVFLSGVTMGMYQIDTNHGIEDLDFNPYLPFVVSDSLTLNSKGQCVTLDRFETETEAANYISTLPDHLSGRYNLDGPPQ